MSKNNFDEYIIAPGNTILELLEANSMTQLDLSYKMGINKKTINEIIKGKAPITVSNAIKLEYVFGLSASFWCNLESNYREKIERKNDYESLKKDEKYLINIPYLEMSKRKWDYIECTNNAMDRVINLRKFFGVASLEFDTELKKKIAFRKANKNISFESLYCWLRYGEIQSNKVACSKFDELKLKKTVVDIRKLANKSFLSQFDKIKEMLALCGVSLIYESCLPNTYVNGLSYNITCDKAIIMLSDRGKRDDILWFTFFHEIGHLIKHSRKEIFIDYEKNEKTNIEIEADNFSKNILIPNKNYNEFIKNKINDSTIKEFCIKNNISTGILVGRLQNDKYIKWNQFNNLITRI